MADNSYFNDSESKAMKKAFRVGKIILAILVIAVVFIWGLIHLFSPTTEMFNQIAETVKIAAQIATAVGAFCIVWITWRRIKVAELNLDQTQIANKANQKAHEDNLSATREGQITERFTQAIEQLGSEKITIRLGGIYALERIARDSKDDHRQVMEVLTAFVRENRPVGDQEEVDLDNLPPLPLDIQAILDVIGRRKIEHEEGTDDRLDLRRTDLQGAFLIEADLKGGGLANADLQGANLNAADLQGADLEHALNLTQAQIDSTDGDEDTTLPEGIQRPVLWSLGDGGSDPPTED
jgi:hypothetical protein